MRPSVFPPPALWVCLGLVVAVDLLLMAAGGFRVRAHGAVMPLAVAAGAWALGYFYATVRTDVRIAALAFGAAFLILFTFAAAVLSYLGTSADLPLRDAMFARADAALGLDWMSVLAFTDARPALGATLRLAYASSLLQAALAIVVLAATGQLMRLGRFLGLFAATGLATIMISIALPAAGAFVFHNPPVELRDVVGHSAGIWHLEHFQALRSGAMRTIDPSAIEGLITFPSFHTALAVITTWALWRTAYIALPALCLNILVIASTVPVGGHYFVDVIAGALIAALCIAAASLQPWGRTMPFATAAPLAGLARIGAGLMQKADVR